MMTAKSPTSRLNSASQSGKNSVLEMPSIVNEGVVEAEGPLAPTDERPPSAAQSRKSSGRVRSAKSPATHSSMDQALSEDDDDTDLEENTQKTVEHDVTGRAAYLEACSLLGIVPAKYFLQHITEKRMIMRHHGLGDAGMKAVSRAMRVSPHYCNLRELLST